MIQQIVSKQTKIEKIGKDEYYVQSFNPRKTQLYYKVVLRAEKDEISCTCDAFKFNPKFTCKHIDYVVQKEVRIK